MFVKKPSIVTFVVAGGSDFPFEFKWFVETNIHVYHVPEGETPDDTVHIVNPNDYTITSNASKVGGTVTITKPINDGDTITIVRNLPYVREVDYAKRGSFDAATINEDQDYQSYLLADLSELSTLYWRIPIASGGSYSTEFPAPQSNTYIKWNAAGTALESSNEVPEAVVTSSQNAADAANSANQAQLIEWESEAERMTANSYSSEPEDIFVKIYTSDGDSTFTATPTTEYSTLHHSAKAAKSAVDAQLVVTDVQDDITALYLGQSAGTIGFVTKADMDGDLVHDAGTVAIVTNDPTPANNGSYIKLLASGLGSWQQSSFDRVSIVENKVSELEYLHEGTNDPILANDATGFALDFSRIGIDAPVSIKTNNVLTTTDVQEFLTLNTNTYFQITNKDGIEELSPHNLFLNSEAPVEQVVSSLRANGKMVVKIVGSGSAIIGSSLGDENLTYGTVTEAVPLEFTVVSAGRTVRISGITGDVQKIQLAYNYLPTTYIKTLSVAKYGAPISKHPTTGEMMLHVENAKTNYLLTSHTPATQTVTLNAGTYTLWINGAGDVTMSGAATGTATEGNSVTFTLALAGDVTFTVNGVVSFFQCENGSYPSSKIFTEGASLARSTPRVSFLMSQIPDIGDEYLFYMDCHVGYSASSLHFANLDNGTGLSNYINFKTSGTKFAAKVNINSIAELDTPTTIDVTPYSRFEITAKLKNNLSCITAQGIPAGLVGSYVGQTVKPTQISVGDWNGTTSEELYVKRIAFIPKNNMMTKDVAPYFYDYPISDRSYDIFLLAGQSNVYSSPTLDPLIDVSGGRTFQFDNSGTLSEANEPLNHPIPYPDNIGFGVAFSRDYYIPNGQAPRKDALLLPCAIGNTGFFDNRWNADKDLFHSAMSTIGVALSTFPNSRLRAVLWMQGEREADQGWTQAQYELEFDAMINKFRADFGSEVPFIIGGMRPNWVNDNPIRQGVDNAHRATPNRVRFTAFADPLAAPQIGVTGGTDAHYSAEDARIFGGKFFDAWSVL